MSIIDLYDLFIHNPQITTDSRNCPKGSIFFALKGDKFDGNQYAAALKADADRDGQDLVYVDQVGTFLNLGRNLETVMSPRWGETNSGVRLVRYPVYPESAGIDFQNIDEVEFRLSEVVYTLAECKMRAGDTEGPKASLHFAVT